MIGAAVNFAGNAFGGFASAGLAGGGAVADAAGRLIAGSDLAALAGGRGGIAQVEAALKTLRGTLSAARDSADAVAGATTLQPVTATITRYVDEPTWVTIDGKPVQNGTVTVAQGTQELVVGYRRVARAPLAVHDAVKALSAAVANVVSAAGQDGGSAGAFAQNVSSLLKNADFNKAVTTPDAASLDSALQQIDGLLAGATGLGVTLDNRASAAAQAGLGALLLGASPVAGGATSAARAYSASATPAQSPPNGDAFTTLA